MRASMMLVIVALHMAQVFIWGAYKTPREATWTNERGPTMATEQTAQAARAEAGAVADKVKEETKNVAQQAQQQATTALRQVQGDLRDRANDETSKFAQTLHDTADLDDEMRHLVDALAG